MKAKPGRKKKVVKTVTKKNEALSKKELLRRKLEKLKLTHRQYQILLKICDSKTNNEIAKIYKISKRTVDTHRENLFAKTKAKNAIDLFKYALRHELYKLR